MKGLQVQRRAVLWLGALFLTACATKRTLPPAASAHWSGRLSLVVQSDPPQQWSAGFELQGSAAQGEMLLTSPIGTSLARLSWTPQMAQLEQGGQTLRSANLSSLIERLQGTALPVSALFEWLAGRASDVPGWHADLSAHAQGRVVAQRSHPEPAAVLRIVIDP